MKQKYNGGYSLLEVLIAIVLLGLLVVPTCTGLVMSVQMNAKTERMMQAQLAVSSAVETLMAEGISAESEDYDPNDYFDDVNIKTVDCGSYYEVTVTSQSEASVFVKTSIRAVAAPSQNDGTEVGTE